MTKVSGVRGGQQEQPQLRAGPGRARLLQVGRPRVGDRKTTESPCELAATEPVGAPGRPWRRLLLAFLACLGVALWLTHGMLRSPGSIWIGKGGDPILFMWSLRWIPWALTHGHDPLVTTYLRYPDGVNLMWNTSVPLAGLLLWPVTATLGPIGSLNLLVVLGYTLSGWCMYLAASRYVTSWSAALTAGLVYELSPFMFSHGYGHFHLVLAFVPPLLLLVGDELLVRQRWPLWRVGGALGALVAGQVLLAEMLALCEALMATIGVALLLLLYRGEARARWRYALKGLAVAVAVAVAVLAVPLAVQFLGPGRVHGAIQPRDVYVSDALGFFVPTTLQWHVPGWPSALAHRYPYTGNGTEWTSYLGVPLVLLLVAVTVRHWRRPIVRLASLLLLAAAVLSLGPRLHLAGRIHPAVMLPWRLMEILPLTENVEPGRLTIFTHLFAALLLAVFVDAVLRQPRWTVRLSGVALAAVVLLSYVPGGPLPTGRTQVPAFFTSTAVSAIPDGGVALVAPFPNRPDTVAPMLWQAAAGMRFRMPGGYMVGPTPSGRPTFEPIPTATSTTMAAIRNGGPTPPLTPALRRRLLDDLAAWKVTAVLIGPMPNQAEMVAFVSALLARPPTSEGGVYLWLLPGGAAQMPRSTGTR
jgi:hypothetical protein